jgi:hypothetical protein
MDELISQIYYINQEISRLWSLTAPNWIQSWSDVLYLIIYGLIIRSFIFQGITDRLDRIAYKLDVASVNLRNIEIVLKNMHSLEIVLKNMHSQIQYQSGILANIDRRTHYRKTRGVPRD